MSIVSLKESDQLYQVSEGVFGFTFRRNNEDLFLRMQLLTKQNQERWSYKEWSGAIANSSERDPLGTLAYWAGTDKSFHPSYGFTESEFKDLEEKIVKLKNKTDGKIISLLAKNSAGINYMNTYADGHRYIVYITRNRDFSILNCNQVDCKSGVSSDQFNVKNFFKYYKDILIAMGSDFSQENSFHNRGIARNPYWVIEEKYAGLSMILQAFTGAFAANYFPDKILMKVKPTFIMQTILKKSLNKGDGYVEQNEGESVDITEYQPKEGMESPMNYIKVSALARIFNDTLI